MFRLFFFVLFGSISASACGQIIICKSVNNRTGAPIKGLIIYLKDSCSGSEFIDSTDNRGITRFKVNDSCSTFYFFSDGINPQPCSDGYLSFKKTFRSFPRDTVLINPVQLIVDYDLPVFAFKESSFIFASLWDTLEYCDLLSPDTTCSAFHDLNFYRTFSCIGYSRIQLMSLYVKSEANTVGDSLARKRCELLIDYLYAHGLSRNITFEIRCMPYEKRPRKSPYGYYLPEFDCVTPMILEY